MKISKIKYSKISVTGEMSKRTSAKREKEIKILTDWLRSENKEEIADIILENKEVITSRLEIRFDTSSQDEFDFIFCFKNEFLTTFLIIEVEEQLVMTTKQIREAIDKKTKKIDKFISLIKFKNSTNNSRFNILRAVVIWQSNEFFPLEGSIEIFNNWNNEDIILERNEVKKELFLIFNKAIGLWRSIPLVFYSEFELPTILHSKFYEVIHSLNNPLIKVIIINGCPGSGKTIIATNLYKLLIDSNKKATLYYLVNSIYKIIETNPEIEDKYKERIFFGNFGSSSFDWDYLKNSKYIIFDEAQRLFDGQSQKIFNNLKQDSKIILLGDDDQKIRPSEKGFIIPPSWEIKKIFLDSSFFRFSQEHLFFLRDFIKDGRLKSKQYSSDLNINFQVRNKWELLNLSEFMTNKDQTIIMLEPYINNSLQNSIKLGPLSSQGNEFDIVVFDLRDLEILSVTKTEIKYKSRNDITNYFGEDNISEITDELTKSGIYSGLTRATQEIYLIGNEEMRIYFENGIKILRNKDENK